MKDALFCSNNKLFGEVEKIKEEIRKEIHDKSRNKSSSPSASSFSAARAEHNKAKHSDR